MVTYDTLANGTQSAVFAILKANSTVQNYTEKILDGFATASIREQAALCLVHTPSITESNAACGKFRRAIVSMNIDCIAKQESTCRKLSDAVRKALEDNLTSINGANLRRKKISSTSVGAIDLSTGHTIDSRVIIIVTVDFDWMGES